MNRLDTACKESPESRVQGTSNFAYSGPFNEMVLLGVLAIRLQGLNKALAWDGENMRFTNISPKEELKIVKSDDFKVVTDIRLLTRSIILSTPWKVQIHILSIITARDGSYQICLYKN